MSLISPNVRNRGQAGKHLLPTSFSQFDPTTDLGPMGRRTVVAILQSEQWCQQPP
jgi:hypothetical protein